MNILEVMSNRERYLITEKTKQFGARSIMLHSESEKQFTVTITERTGKLGIEIDGHEHSQ